MTPLVILCFARSGGTILNKFLASQKNTVVLSEVNPNGCGSGLTVETNSIEGQMQSWYGVKMPDFDSFSEKVRYVYDYCFEEKKQLIIRDWSWLNFEASAFNSYMPNQKFSILDEIPFPFKVIGFTRHPIDVWASRGMKEFEVFFAQYEIYTKKLQSESQVLLKYEELVSEPKKTIEEILGTIQLSEQELVNQALAYNNVNGDIQNGIKHYDSLRAPVRKDIGQKNVLRTFVNISYLRSCFNTGYSPLYFDSLRTMKYLFS